MSPKSKPEKNYDRLLNHLKSNSLAAALVRSYRDHEADGPAEAMKTVLKERLAKVREKIDSPET
jgi:hypothetical protein